MEKAVEEGKMRKKLNQKLGEETGLEKQNERKGGAGKKGQRRNTRKELMQ